MVIRLSPASLQDSHQWPPHIIWAIQNDLPSLSEIDQLRRPGQLARAGPPIPIRELVRKLLGRRSAPHGLILVLHDPLPGDALAHIHVQLLLQGVHLIGELLVPQSGEVQGRKGAFHDVLVGHVSGEGASAFPEKETFHVLFSQHIQHPRGNRGKVGRITWTLTFTQARNPIPLTKPPPGSLPTSVWSQVTLALP